MAELLVENVLNRSIPYDSDDDERDELLDIIRQEEEKEVNNASRAHSSDVENSENSSDDREPKVKIRKLKSSEARKKQRIIKENITTHYVKNERTEQLERLVFGGREYLLKNLEKAADVETGLTGDDGNNKKEKRQPAWRDSDDENYVFGETVKANKKNNYLSHHDKKKSYEEHLKSTFVRLTGNPKWADLDQVREVDSDEELLQTIGHLTHPSSSDLTANHIECKRMRDVNQSTNEKGSITSVLFHPSSTVALVAGMAGLVSIYSIDGLKNDILHNVQFKNFPIKCARILSGGTEVLLGGSHKYFYSYNLMEAQEKRIILPKPLTKLTKFEISPCEKYIAVPGRFGEVHILESKAKERLYTFKQEDPCSAVCFSTNSMKLFSHSETSRVSIFDIRQQRIEHFFEDDGCIKGKTLSISPNGAMLATGSNEGVVNIYKYSDVFETKIPQPQKIIYNLTTSITATKFNHSSEILAMCSDNIADAVKLVHFPTGTVFSNFPTLNANLGHIRTIDFSPNSGFMAMGNTTKKVRLFRLKHYKNY